MCIRDRFNYGAKNYDRAKKTFIISVLASTSFFVVGALVIQIAPQVLVGMFNKDAELMNITINGLRKYTLALPMIGISIVGTNSVSYTHLLIPVILVAAICLQINILL